MKLTEENSRFAVVKTAFHNGGTYSFHNSLVEARRAQRSQQSESCECGCAGIVPITVEAVAEMLKEVDRNGNPICFDRPVMYRNLPTWEPGKYSPYQLCR